MTFASIYDLIGYIHQHYISFEGHEVYPCSANSAVCHKLEETAYCLNAERAKKYSFTGILEKTNQPMIITIGREALGFTYTEQPA